MEITPGRTCPTFLFYLTALLLMLTACEVYEPYYYQPSQYDRVWDSAIKAAEDVGVYISTADGVTGTITGSKGPAEVTMTVQTQADGRIRLQINVREPEGYDSHLNDRLYDAYRRYMGR